MATAASEKVDCHLHVWSDEKIDGTYTMRGEADLLVKEMDAAGVIKAVIIQPGNHGFDHSYVSGVIAKHPGRFAGVVLANPDPGPQAGPNDLSGCVGVNEIERLVVHEGYKGVRFNPYIWPEGEGMANGVGRLMYEKCGALGVPVSFMCFKGLLLHIDEIRSLATAYPNTDFVMDHFGFCKLDDLESEEWKALLSLAAFPRAYVKLSAAFRVSTEPFPHADARPAIRKLLAAFGKERLLWGTDFPWVTQKDGGYGGAWSLVERGDEAEGSDPLLTSDEKLWIYGKTASSLYFKEA